METRIRQKMNDFHHETGLLYGIGFTGIFFLLVCALYGAVKVVMICMIFGLMIGLIIKLITKGEGIMGDIIRRALGIREIKMKMQALADYLKVKFIHIPEHYKCKKLD